MIRFSCPHCGREYALADFMARLPLLCKGCGQRLDVPDPTPEPPPAPKPPPPPAQATPKREPVAAPVLPTRGLTPPGSPNPAPAATDDEFLSRETLARLDEVTALPEPPPPTKPAEPPPPPPVVTAPRPAPRKAMAIVADVAVVLVLLGLGVLLGEFAARKPTAEILENASGPKFPPIDLLVWLGGPVLLLLIYAWLGSRGWTVGGWLKRRSAA